MQRMRLRLCGGPWDGETATVTVPDGEAPPEEYTATRHGPHESEMPVRYRLIGRDPRDCAGANTWVYEASPKW